MKHLMYLIVVFFVRAQASSELPSGAAQSGETTGSLSPLHVIASAYGATGGYSTGTASRSLSGYITLTNAWVDYYTIGYSTLWLERDDAGGKYYTQHLAAARASWFLPPRVTLAMHYAYLNEGEIQTFSDPAIFHLIGGGISYWFSPFQVAGTSFTLSMSEGKLVAGMLRGMFSFEVAAGIWSTSTALLSDASWTPQLFSFHQTISVPLGNESSVVVSGSLGRRGLYFDDEALVVYNQRVVQTGSVQLKAIVKIADSFFVVPSFEHNTHDEYSASYGALGVRVFF